MKKALARFEQETYDENPLSVVIFQSATFYPLSRHPANSPDATAPGTCRGALLGAQATAYV